MRNRPIFNLRSKVILSFLVLVLIPLAIIGTFSIKATERLIFDMVKRQFENVALDKTTILERWIEERKNDLIVISGTSIIRSLDPKIMAPYLNLVQKGYLVYEKFTVISAGGDIVYSTEETADNEDIIIAEAYSFKDHLFLSDIVYDATENESFFNITTPILDENFKIIGSLYGTIGTGQIISSILNVSLGETGECYLVDKNGRFLAHKEPHRILSENISRTESFENIFTRDNQKKIYLDYRGIEVLGASKKIGGTEWYLVVEQDRDEAFQGLDILKLIIYLTIILCIVSAFMLIWIISYHIVNPIRALSQSADILANSEFEKALIKTDRRDEIGMLYHAFENMTIKLQDRHNNLVREVDLKKAELKETDSILRQTKLIAERSEKYAAIGRLGAAVAHEIRTPLTSLKLFLESVHSEFSLSQAYQEDLAIAMKEIKRIEATINRFLDFSKPQQLIITDIDISKLIEDILSIIKPMINKNECSLDIKIGNDLHDIHGDKKLLGEALINILVNSLEVTPPDGRLSVIAERDQYVVNNKSQPCIRIDIRDTGPGIPEDQIAHIFEPFFTTKSSGTGLGLSIAVKTVKSHGGFISVKSAINEGTTFSLFLPLEFNPEMFQKNGQDITY
ncbi:MAG: Cache 3/Cache 2 fusion domain-containing protein [Deltaproteobacteria bacterium]|nr:Cache 3/Cache 2 fusion domain-containing protein [Deltaproteobacteria bacterium]